MDTIDTIQTLLDKSARDPDPATFLYAGEKRPEDTCIVILKGNGSVQWLKAKLIEKKLLSPK